MKSKNHKVIIIFDIETDQFVEEFKNAKTEAKRLSLVPKMRVACALLIRGRSRMFHYFTPADARRLIDLLLSADEIVSFNGKQFDLLVLRKHHGLSVSQIAAINKKHLDLHEVFSERVGWRVSLDSMARSNLDQGKLRKGREMDVLTLDMLKVACRSDVNQTFKLYRLECKKRVALPQRRAREDIREFGPHHHLPHRIEGYIDLDISEMSEGQMAEYLAGTWGVTNFGELVEM